MDKCPHCDIKKANIFNCYQLFGDGKIPPLCFDITWLKVMK